MNAIICEGTTSTGSKIEYPLIYQSLSITNHLYQSPTISISLQSPLSNIKYPVSSTIQYPVTFLPTIIFHFSNLTCTFAAVGCDFYRLKGIRCKAGTVPAAVSHFESIVTQATFPDKSGLGRQQLFDESEDLPAKILDEQTSGVRFRESP